MAAVSVSQMIAAEKAALANGWSEAELMHLAGEALGHAIARHFPRPGTAIAYLGKGHNAGDALIATRVLRDHYGWQTACRAAFPTDRCAPLVQQHAAAFHADDFLSEPPDPACSRHPLLLIDGLLGTGGNGPLRDPLLELAAEMQTLRNQHGARVAAVDIPSGIDTDHGHPGPGCVHADATFMIGNAKKGLLLSTAINHTGSLAIVPVPPLNLPSGSDPDLVCPQTTDFGKRPRNHDLHKGSAGKVGIIGGSAEYSGAAVIAATGALRSGAGLVTLHVDNQIHSLVSSKCPPEIIVRGYDSFDQVNANTADSWVVGCGLGLLPSTHADALLRWIDTCPKPLVIDADALNLIARRQRHDLLRESHVITPHPGEFHRLAPDLDGATREIAARSFSNKFPATLLLKGARTIITQQGASLWYNSTGTHGMASAGMGDLLTGVIGSQLAAQLCQLDAARLAAWLCGRAAEIAVNDNSHLSPESLTSSDAAHHLGSAIRDWQQATR